MSTESPSYVVAWQLPEEGGNDREDLVALAQGGPMVFDGRAQAWARFAGLLAGADVAAIVSCRQADMTVEVADPPTPGLAIGGILGAGHFLGPAAQAALTSLLAGRSAWLDCLPPRGFRSAALITAPSLPPSRLLLVARREHRFDKRNLGLAAAYLALAKGPDGPRPDLRAAA